MENIGILVQLQKQPRIILKISIQKLHQREKLKIEYIVTATVNILKYHVLFDTELILLYLMITKNKWIKLKTKNVVTVINATHLFYYIQRWQEKSNNNKKFQIFVLFVQA